MKKLIVLILMACSACGQIPDPTDPGGQSTNTTGNTQAEYVPQPVEDGAIIVRNMTSKSIDWFNLHHSWFGVYWRESLTDGDWILVADAYSEYEHNYPDGFYAVMPYSNIVAIPVANSGTTNMAWEAFILPEDGGDTWLEVVDCVNTNVEPEKSDAWIIIEMIGNPPSGITKGYFQVQTIPSGNEPVQVAQGTIMHGGY